MQAMRWGGMDPYSVASKTYVIPGSGKLSYESQLVSAVINSSSKINGRLHYQYSEGWEAILGHKPIKKTSQKGKDFFIKGWPDESEHGLWCRVGAVIQGESEMTWGEPVYLQSVITRNSTNWVNDPKQQIAYLASQRWSRLYAPELILGVYTSDELQDTPKEKDITPTKPESAIRGPSKTNEAAVQAESVVEAQEPEREIPDRQQEVVDALMKVMADCKTIDELDSVIEPINSKLTGRNKNLCLTAYEKRKDQIFKQTQ